MKLSNLVMAGMLVAAAMIAVVAPVAKADGVIDPRIIINKGGDPLCGTEGQLACVPADGVLPTLTFGGADETVQFAYNCPDGTSDCTLADLFSVTADLNGVPNGAAIGCASDVFVECHTTSTAYFDPTTGTILMNLHVVFDDGSFDTPSPCLNPFTQGAICSGFLHQGDSVVEYIQTPEPASLALLGAGLLGVFGLGRKRWMSARSS